MRLGATRPPRASTGTTASVSRHETIRGSTTGLKREADTTRIYTIACLQHLKEAGFSPELKASEIRVVDPAKPPQVPASPKVALNLSLAATLGLLLGVGLAFLTESHGQVEWRQVVFPHPAPHWYQDLMVQRDGLRQKKQRITERRERLVEVACSRIRNSIGR